MPFCVCVFLFVYMPTTTAIISDCGPVRIACRLKLPHNCFEFHINFRAEKTLIWGNGMVVPRTYIYIYIYIQNFVNRFIVYLKVWYLHEGCRFIAINNICMIFLLCKILGPHSGTFGTQYLWDMVPRHWVLCVRLLKNTTLYRNVGNQSPSTVSPQPTVTEKRIHRH